MINVSLLTEQFLEHFKAQPAFSGWTIERGEPLNTNESVAANGWVGIYRDRVGYDPKSLGRNTTNWRGALEIRFVVQASSLLSAEDCEDLLEGRINSLIRSILTVERTMVDNFDAITVDYSYDEADRRTLYFQSALIAVAMQVSIEET